MRYERFDRLRAIPQLPMLIGLSLAQSQFSIVHLFFLRPGPVEAARMRSTIRINRTKLNLHCTRAKANYAIYPVPFPSEVCAMSLRAEYVGKVRTTKNGINLLV